MGCHESREEPTEQTNLVDPIRDIFVSSRQPASHQQGDAPARPFLVAPVPPLVDDDPGLDFEVKEIETEELQDDEGENGKNRKVINGLHVMSVLGKGAMSFVRLVQRDGRSFVR